MKFILFLQFLVFGVTFGHAQDSILITNHHAVAQEIECCKKSKNQLRCIDSLIAVNQVLKEYGKDHIRPFIKQKKALYIYHINAGWINNRRGNFEAGKEHFKMAAQYVNSLKQWEHYDKDIEQIETNLVSFKELWCFRTYRKDTSAFYACDCAKLFPELNEEEHDDNYKEDVNTEIPDSNSVKQVTELKLSDVKLNNLFGKFYLNDTLRIDPRFACDSASRKYFELNKSHILSSLSKEPISEIILETSVGKNRIDTLIIRVDLNFEPNNLMKKCSIVYSNCPDFLSQHYLYIFINMVFFYPRENVSFYVPIVINSLEPDFLFNLNQSVLENDHFLILSEMLPRLRPK